MPEGPSILILKEKLENLHIKGDTLVGTGGNAKIDYALIEDKKLVTFKSWASIC